MKNEETGYTEEVSFLSKSEKTNIFKELQIFVEERVDYYAKLQKDVRIEVPLGINEIGEYRAPSIWSSIIIDLIEFSLVYPDYGFLVKVSESGFKVKDYYCFRSGRKTSITSGRYDYLISKKYYSYMCAKQEDIATNKVFSIEQLLSFSPRKLAIKENFKDFINFGLNLFDSDEDYYASNLIYSAYDKFNAHGYRYDIFKLNHEKKPKRLDVQCYQLNKLEKILKALQYSYQHHKFNQKLESYQPHQIEVIKNYYKELLQLTQYAVQNKLEILMVVVPENLDLSLIDNEK